MIRVSKNKRYLEKDGKLYPYLADTAWTLLQRLTRDEIIFYLDKRAEQGFNAIQVSAISEFDGIRTPNREGNLPFIGENVYKPNPKYFELLKFLLAECKKRDITLTLLPTWGDKFNKKWGVGPEIFTAENARSYCNFLSDFVGDFENVIFMLGGDRPVETDTHRKIINEMAKGLKTGEKVRHLITYHPCGEATSFDFLKDCDCLDFHSVQSGHSFGGYKSDKMIDFVLKNSDKPCLDAECFYEDFPLNFTLESGHRFTSDDIRKRMYLNLLSGALGTVYGHQSVWCFKESADREYLFDWKTALNRPMANQVGNIIRFLEKVNIEDMKPYPYCRFTKALYNGKTMVIYAENSISAFVNIGKESIIKSSFWFDCVCGEFSDADIKDSGFIKAKSPFSGDALLVLNFQ